MARKRENAIKGEIEIKFKKRVKEKRHTERGKGGRRRQR